MKVQSLFHVVFKTSAVSLAGPWLKKKDVNFYLKKYL